MKEWVKKHRDISQEAYEKTLLALSQGAVHEEKITVGMLLSYLPRHRRHLHPFFVDRLLETREGWLEVDSICQNIFTAEEILASWAQWHLLLSQFVRDENIQKRRASLVLLVGPVTYNESIKLADLAFEQIEHVKHEKEILLTKAVSWLLRSLIKHHKERVGEYVTTMSNSLPKIAMRETKQKLHTGKKI